MTSLNKRKKEGLRQNMASRIAIRHTMMAMTFGALVLAAPAHADDGAEYPDAVPTFANICLVPGVDPQDRVNALTAAKGWTEDADVNVYIEGLGKSRAIEVNYSFKNVKEARQWSGMIDGQKARIVLASFDGKVRYPNLCALVMEGAKNALPYGRDLGEAFKAYGVKGKSVDLVHYYEFAGKLKPGEHPVETKHPVRGEIFTRSQSGYTEETMHIYLAY